MLLIQVLLRHVAVAVVVLAHGIAAETHEDEGCLSSPESSSGLAVLQRSSSSLEHSPAAVANVANKVVTKQQSPSAVAKVAKSTPAAVGKKAKQQTVAKVANQQTPSAVVRAKQPPPSAVAKASQQPAAVATAPTQQMPSAVAKVINQQKPSPVAKVAPQQMPVGVAKVANQQLPSAVASVDNQQAVVIAGKTSAQGQAVVSASTSQADGMSVSSFQSLKDVPVLVHLARPVSDERVRWIFKPIMDTIEDAFTAKGANVLFSYTTDNCEVGNQVKEYAWKGVRPIVISICSHLIYEKPIETKCSYEDTWTSLRKNGAYLIVYNSESHPPYMKTTLKLAKKWEVHEMWHYSKYIIGQMEPWTDVSLHRFLPPGCATHLDFAVDTDAPLRDDTKVGFIGYWAGRTDETKKAYAAMKGIVDVGGRYFSEPLVRRYLQQFPIQLNIHGTFNVGSEAALESFRYAMLLANSACVVSEPGHPLDMETWEGIVIFKKQHQMQAALESLVNHRSAVDSCRAKSRAAFCEKFLPEKLLNESGFMDTWQGLEKLAPKSNSIANAIATSASK